MARRHGRTTAKAAGSTRAAGGGASRASNYVPPWLVWLALPLPGALFWALASAGTAAAVLIGGLLAIGSTVLVIHTFSVFARRKDLRVPWDAAVTVALACLWVMATAAFGLFHNPHVDVWPQLYRIPELVVKAFTLPVWGSWLAGGPLVALAWNIRRAAMTNPDTEGEIVEDSPLDRVLDGARLKAIEASDQGQITARLEGDRGRHTSDDLQKMASGIEAASKLREGAVRIAKDPKDRGSATVVITPNDPLEKDLAWPGPSLPGGHLADAPIPFGANGSGKSMAWRAAIADVLTRTAGAGIRLHGIDVSGKWRQTFGPLIPYMTSLARDNKSAKKLIRELSAYVAEKQERMGAAGHTQWSKECGEPYDILWLEEGSEIAADSQELTRAAERWRSAGCELIIVIQRASWDNIDTTTRSQLGGATAFGVNDGGQSSNSLSLPSVAIDQGADPARWGSRHPGRHYLITSTTPEDRMAIPHKSFKTTNDELADELAKHCTPVRDENGELLGSSPRVEAYDPGSDVDGQSREARAARTRRDVGEDEDDEGMAAIPEDPDPSIVVDPSKPITPPTQAENIPMAVPGVGGPKISDREFKALIQAHLKAILAAGREKTQAADVHRMRPETGFSREAVRLELVRLCAGPFTDADVFRLRRDEDDRLGVYEIYEHADAYAG
jgi:hypothetical protein